MAITILTTNTITIAITMTISITILTIRTSRPHFMPGVVQAEAREALRPVLALQQAATHSNETALRIVLVEKQRHHSNNDSRDNDKSIGGFGVRDLRIWAIV